MIVQELNHTKPVVIDGVLHCSHCRKSWPCEPNIITAQRIAAALGIGKD